MTAESGRLRGFAIAEEGETGRIAGLAESTSPSRVAVAVGRGDVGEVGIAERWRRGSSFMSQGRANSATLGFLAGDNMGGCEVGAGGEGETICRRGVEFRESRRTRANSEPRRPFILGRNMGRDRKGGSWARFGCWYKL